MVRKKYRKIIIKTNRKSSLNGRLMEFFVKTTCGSWIVGRRWVCGTVVFKDRSISVCLKNGSYNIRSFSEVSLKTYGQFEQVPDLDYALNYPMPIPSEGNDEMYGMVGKPI